MEERKLAEYVARFWKAEWTGRGVELDPICGGFLIRIYSDAQRGNLIGGGFVCWNEEGF